MARSWFTQTRLVTTAIAAVAAGVLSGIPSTAWALVTDGDPWEATRAAAAALVGRDTWFPLQLAAATIVHGSMSVFWASVLCAWLPPKRAVLDGLGAGFSIAVLDMLAIGTVIPVMRELPFLPQLADHLCFGGIVGAVIAWRARRGIVEPPIVAWKLSRKAIRRSFLILPALFAAISLVVDEGAFLMGLLGTGMALVSVVCLQFADFPWENPEELLVLVVLIIGVVAAVIAIRRPDRGGWLFCAHACLSAYFVMSWSIGRGIFHSMSL